MKESYQIVGVVDIRLLDAEGKVLRVVRDHNSETLWAQIVNTPSISLDFITRTWKDIFGLPLSVVNKTGYGAAQTSAIRSGLLSSAFTRSGTTYSCKFNWTNNTQNNTIIYGLVSFSGNNTYTIFDLSSDPLIVAPQNVLIGQYNITYSGSVPGIPGSSNSSSTYQNTNAILTQLRDIVDTEVRRYKYQRVFLKTSDYYGCDLNDTAVQSTTSVSISSSRADGRALCENYTGELIYKFVEGGLLGGARAIRSINYQATYLGGGVLNGLYFGDVEYDYVPSIASTSHYGYQPSTYTTIRANKYKEIKPFKIKFPTTATKFGSSSLFHNIAGMGCNRYTHLWYGPLQNNETQGGMVMYLYWPASPNFSVYVAQANYKYPTSSNLTVTPTVTLYVNGVAYSSTATLLSKYETYDNFGEWSYIRSNLLRSKHTFNLTGLSAGSGIVAISVTASSNGYGPANHITLAAYQNRGYQLVITGDMYGYAVPYAGMLTPDSGDITTDWISSSFAGVSGGTDQAIPSFTAGIDQFNILTTVNNTPVSNLPQYTNNHTWVWVKESQADSLAGIIEVGNTGKVPMSCGMYNPTGSAYRSPVFLYYPIFLGDFTLFSVAKMEFDQDYWALNVGSSSHWYWYDHSYFEHLVNAGVNPNMIVNQTTRSIEYINDRCMEIAAGKCYLARPQGESNYELVPYTATDYTEGVPTVIVDGVTWEYETLVQEAEYLKYITVQIDSDSLFVTNEFMTIPINDGNRNLCIDALETWYVTSATTPSTSYDPITDTLSIGVDSIIGDDRSQSWRAFQRAGDQEEIQLFTPQTTMNLSDGRFTHYLTYSITYEYGGTVPHISIPKYIEENSVKKFVDVTEIYLTDGLHVIPWSLDPFGHDVLDDLGMKEYFYAWVISPNMRTLEQLFPKYKDHVIVLYAYIVAKPKEELLPLTFDVSYTDITQNLSAGAITKVALPFCVDRYIQVTNAETDEPLEFTILQAFNFPVASDDDLGTNIYVKLPAFSKAQELKQAFMKIGVRVGTSVRDANTGISTYNLTNEVTPFASTAHRYCIPYDSYSALTTQTGVWGAYTGGTYISVNDTNYFENFNFSMSPDWIAHPSKISIKIDISEDVNMQVPDNFFRLYLTPSTFVNKATQVYNLSASEYTITAGVFRYSKSNAGLSYSITTDVNEPLEFEYYLGQAATNFIEFATVNSGTLSSSSGVSASYAARHNLLYIRRNYSESYTRGLSSQSAYADGEVHYFHTPITTQSSTNLLIYNAASLITVSVYKASPFIRHKYRYLNVEIYRPSRTWGTEDTDFYVYKPNKLIPIKKLSDAPTKRLMLTNKSLSHKFGPAIYSLPVTGMPESFKIYTYTVEGVTSNFAHYQSTAGQFILTDPSLTTTYDVLISNRLRAAGEMAKARYIFTVNPNLSALLLSGYSFSVPITFLGTTSLNTVPLRTSCSSTPSTTVCILDKIAPINMFSYDYNAALTGFTRRDETASQMIPDRKKEYFDSVTDIAVVMDGGYNRYIDRSVSTTNGGQCMLGWKQPVFDYQHLHQLYLTRTVTNFQNLNGARLYTLSKTDATYSTLSALDEEAFRADSLVVARTNKRFNVVFDNNAIPIQKITRFGHFSPHMYTDEHGVEGVYFMPLIKLHDSILEQDSIFAVDSQYYSPVDVTTTVPELTDSNIQVRLFNHYLYNCYTYDHFNRLLVTHNDARYTVQLGFLVYSSTLDRLVAFNSLSVQMCMTDTTEYVPINWCYANDKAGIFTDDVSELRPSASPKIKLYNPNAVALTNYPVEIDISSLTKSSFSSGLVFSISGTPVPTAYVIDTKGHVSTDHNDALYTKAWAKIPSFPANSYIEVNPSDLVNTYTLDDVFSFYEGFDGTSIDDTKWTYNFTGTTAVADGALSIAGGTGTPNGIASIQSLDPSLRYEACYQTVSPNRPSIWDLEMGYGNVLAGTMPSLQDGTICERLSRDSQALLSVRSTSSPVPYWNDTVASETWLRASLKQGDNSFYVYYNGTNANDISDGNSVFLLFEDHSLLDYDPNKWHLFDGGLYTEGTSGTSTWRYQPTILCGTKPSVFASSIEGSTNSLLFESTPATGMTCTSSISDCALGSNDFTIDGWFYSNDVNNPSALRWIFSKTGGNNTWTTASGGISYTLFHNTDGKLYLQWSVPTNTYAQLASSAAVSFAKAWHHIAVVQDATYLTMYLDGVQIAQQNRVSVQDVGSGTPQIGLGNAPGSQLANLGGSQTGWNGYISNFRLSVGTARWTEAFTPPTTYYDSDTYTKVLVRGNDSIYALSIADTSGTGKTWNQVNIGALNPKNSIVLLNSWGQANILYNSRRFFDRDAFAADVTIAAQSGSRNFMLGWMNLWHAVVDTNGASNAGLWRITRDRTSGISPQSTPYQGTRIEGWYPGNQSSTTIPGRYSFMVNGVSKSYDKLNSEHSFSAGNYTRELGRLSVGGLNGWLNVAASTVAIREIRVRNWNKDATISISYGTIEQSTWIVDGIPFTRRIPVTINSSIDLEAYQVVLNPAQWGKDYNLRVTGAGGVTPVRPYPEYDTSCTPVVSSLRPLNNSVSFSHIPIDGDVWWIDKINKVGVEVFAPSTGKLAVVARPGVSTDVTKVYWIRARAYANIEPIQMKEEDIKIMVEKKSTDWYLFDTSESSSSDKTYIVNCLNTSLATMVCGMYNKKQWVEFPDQTRYNAGFPGGYGRYIEYRK